MISSYNIKVQLTVSSGSQSLENTCKLSASSVVKFLFSPVFLIFLVYALKYCQTFFDIVHFLIKQFKKHRHKQVNYF